MTGPPDRRRAYLGIGSNLGDRLAYLQLAVDELAAADGVTVVAVSPVYETAPVGGPEQPDYLNAVVAVDTDARPPASCSSVAPPHRGRGRAACARCAGGRARSTSTSCSSATSASTSPISWSRTRGCPSGRSCSCRWPTSTRPGGRASPADRDAVRPTRLALSVARVDRHPYRGWNEGARTS